MTPIESVRLAIEDISANEHHGVIPARLARDLVFQVAHDCVDFTAEQVEELKKEADGK